jgi:hypothetical protein
VRLVSPLWYLAALVVVLGGWMAGTVVAAGAWDRVREAPLQNVTERVDAGGASLAVLTDVRQPERDVTCTASARGKGAEPVPLPDAELDLSVVDDGSTWYLIAFDKDGRDDVAVRCTPRDRQADSASYRVAVAEGWQDRASAGNGVAWLLTAAGIALAVATWWSRRRRPQED